MFFKKKKKKDSTKSIKVIDYPVTIINYELFFKFDSSSEKDGKEYDRVETVQNDSTVNVDIYNENYIDIF